LKISLNDIKKYQLDNNKNQSLTFFDRYLYRPVANFIVPILYNNLKLSPNKISLLSLVMALVGFIFIMTGSNQNLIIGLLFLMIWAVLDCADGSLARTLFYKYGAINPLGEFFDAFAGYGVIAFLWLTIGWWAYQDTGNDLFFLVGSVSSALGLFARVSYSKLALVKLKNNLGLNDKDPRKSTLYIIYENLEFGSALFPLLFLAIFFDLLPFFIITYCLVNLAMVLWLLRMVHKEANINNNYYE
jgi:phosphatidylglycerophosphate synthase